MGTYLSKPILDKCCEDGEAMPLSSSNDKNCLDTNLAWAVVDMQGWRKSMEDAHVAQTDVTPPAMAPNVDAVNGDPDAPQDANATKTEKLPPAKVFAVFDGHGGAEVARFCQLYLVDVLTNQEDWKKASPELAGNGTGGADIGKAMVECFHALDCMIDDNERR